MFNLASLLLGLGAWALAFLAIRKPRRNIKFIFGSFACAGVATVCQFFEISHRMNAQDYGAVADTIGATAGAVAVLLAVTFLMNFLAVQIHEYHGKSLGKAESN